MSGRLQELGWVDGRNLQLDIRWLTGGPARARELAAELVHIGAHVMAAGGAIDTFIDAVYNYPTLSDSYKYAAYDGLGHWREWRKERGLGA